MKKKILISMLASCFALGTLASCGGGTPENQNTNPDVENDAMIEENNEKNNGLNEPVGDVENNDTDS